MAAVDAGEEATPATRARRRVDPLCVLGLVIVGVVAILAVIGPSIGAYDPTLTTPDVSIPPPGVTELPGLVSAWLVGGPAPHFLGTDASGFDIFSRLMAAPRTDLVIALFANGLSLVAGLLLGLLAGYFRNFVTEFLMRASDVLQSFPVFISAMVLVALAGRSTANIVIALACVYTPIYIRLTRAEVLNQKNRGFIEAARALGNREFTIALRHVLPNSLKPALIQWPVTIGFAILLTAGLSFVGAGVRPPTPEWGLMIASGANEIIIGEWWSSVFPGIAISITVFGFAVLGDALERLYEA